MKINLNKALESSPSLFKDGRKPLAKYLRENLGILRNFLELSKLFKNMIYLKSPSLLALALLTLQSIHSNGLEKKTLVVLLSNDSSIYEETLAGIQNTLHTTTRVEYLNALIESGGLENFFDQVDNPQKYNAFISLGKPASQVAYKNIKKLPVIFSMVAAPRNLKIPLPKLCGISTHIPISVYFKMYKKINPKVKYFYTFFISDHAAFIAKEGDYVDHQFGSIYERIRIKDTSQFKKTLHKLQNKIDAIHIIPDPLYNEKNFEIISAFSKQNKILLSSNFKELVTLGTTFGFSPNYNQLGAQTARMTQRIIDKVSTCKEEGIQNLSSADFFFNLNESYSAQSGIIIPQDLKQRARQVKRFRAGVELISVKKWKAARIVFGEIQKKDPKNEVVLQYLKFIIKHITGNKTTSLHKRASLLRKRKHFLQARKIYLQILHIDPHSTQASNGLRSLSKQQQLQARKKHKEGKSFVALKIYLQSIKTNRNNKESRNKLLYLRNKLRARIPGLIKQGRHFYNVRKYTNAIVTFNKILLISPKNKIAAEYLSLSKQKKKALLQLRQKP